MTLEWQQWRVGLEEASLTHFYRGNTANPAEL